MFEGGSTKTILSTLILLSASWAFANDFYDNYCTHKGTVQGTTKCCDEWIKLIESGRAIPTANDYCKRACNNILNKEKLPRCDSGGASSASAKKCLDAEKKLSSTTTQAKEVWDACASDCSTASSEATLQRDKDKYSSIADSCSLKNSEMVNPAGDMESDDGATDTVAEDEATSGDEDSGGLDPADTGNPNQQALQSLLGSGLNNSNSRTPIDGGAVDFTGGGRGGGGYADAAGTSGPTGFGGSNIVPAVVIDDMPQEMKAAGNPGGGGGPMAGAGVPGMGGGGMGGAGAGSPSRPGGGGGGPRTSIAGAQLGKVGQNTFWSGSGGAAGSSGSSRKTATAAANIKDKKPAGPAYLNKGTGDAGLLRLFGARPLKLDGGQSQSCADNTVFCSHENYFFRVDRYPNSDINPNSGSK